MNGCKLNDENVYGDASYLKITFKPSLYILVILSGDESECISTVNVK